MLVLSARFRLHIDAVLHQSALALVPNVFWQFSGYLSLLPQTKVTSAYMELVEDSSTGGDAYKWCRKALSAYFSIVLEAFGEERIIWGSGLNLRESFREYSRIRKAHECHGS